MTSWKERKERFFELVTAVWYLFLLGLCVWWGVWWYNAIPTCLDDEVLISGGWRFVCVKGHE